MVLHPDRSAGPLTGTGAGATRGSARRAPAFLALAIALGSIGVFVLPATTFAWSANSFSSDSEQELLVDTNQARVSAGLPDLPWDTTLGSLARWRSQDMIERDYFDHAIPPTGEFVWDVMDQRGICYNLAGENIGWNQNWPDDQATAQIMASFMGSPEHLLEHPRRGLERDRHRRLQGAGRQDHVDRPLRRPLRRLDPYPDPQADAQAHPQAHPEPDAAANGQPITEARRSPPSASPSPSPTPFIGPSQPVSATVVDLRTTTQVVPLRGNSNNVARLRFSFGAAAAGRVVQILVATRHCAAGSVGVACATGRTYGSWTSFTTLTSRVVGPTGVAEVAVSSKRSQGLSLVAVLPATAGHLATRTGAQQVRWH